MNSDKLNRRFGLSLAALCAVVGILSFLRSGAPGYLAFGLAVMALVLSWLRPQWLNPIRVVSNWVSGQIQKVISPIFLALIFFVVFTPGRWVIRGVFRQDLMRLNRNRTAASYWIDREPADGKPAGMENQF